MAMLADVAGAAAPASPVVSASATTDARKSAAAQSDAEGGFATQLTSALTGQAGQPAAGEERPKVSGAKGKQASGAADGQTAGIEDEQEPPLLTFVLPPWLPVASSEVGSESHPSHEAKASDKKAHDSQNTGTTPAEGAAGVATVVLSTTAAITPQLPPPVTVLPTPPPSDTPSAGTPAHTVATDDSPRTVPIQQALEPVPQPIDPPKPAADLVASQTQLASAAVTEVDEPVAASGEPKSAPGLAPEGPPGHAAVQNPAQPQSTRNASYHRSDVAQVRSAWLGPAAPKPEVRSKIQVAPPTTPADAAPRAAGVTAPDVPVAHPVGKASAKSEGGGAERRMPAQIPAMAEGPSPVASPFVAAPEPAVHDPAPLAPASQSIPHVAAPIAATPAALPVVDTALWSPSEGIRQSADVPEADTPDRIVQSLRMQFLRGGGDAVVELRPEHLGPVTVSLKVEQGGVSARIVAADPVVAEWLQAHQDTLRDGLQANGLTLDRLVIDRDGRSPDRRERRETPARPRFRTPADRQSTFELTI